MVSNMDPHMLDQIIPESVVSCLVLHCMMHMEEIDQVGRQPRLGINELNLKFPALIIPLTIMLCTITQATMTSHNVFLLHVLSWCRTIS
jgi:hypothetical protein